MTNENRLRSVESESQRILGAVCFLLVQLGEP